MVHATRRQHGPAVGEMLPSLWPAGWQVRELLLRLLPARVLRTLRSGLASEGEKKPQFQNFATRMHSTNGIESLSEEQLIAAFGTCHVGMGEMLLKAASIVRQGLVRFPKFVDKLAERYGCSRRYLERLSVVGDGSRPTDRILPEVFLAVEPGLQRLRYLPVDQQKRYLVEPVELLLMDVPGGPDVVLKKVAELPVNDCPFVIVKTGRDKDSWHVADAAEQRLLREKARAKEKERKSIDAPRYEIDRRGRLYFRFEGPWDPAEVLEIAKRAMPKHK